MALLPSDPQQQKRFVIGALPLLLLFGYYQFLHGSRVEQADALESRLEQLTATNNAAKAIASRGGPELEKRLAIYEQHMRQLEELIPKREEVAELLHAMTLRAKSSGVDLTKVKPEADDPGPFYTKKVYELGVKGTYHDVASFLTEIGSLPRIVTPIDLKLVKPQGGAMARNGAPVLEANFRIVTYVIPEPATASADSANANVKG
jgi:type IV pilus assembly protein PilO